MRHALLVAGDPAEGLRLAASWVAAGDEVVAVLLADAAALARPGHGDDAVAAALGAGVAVLAHDEALERRGIAAPIAGVGTVDLDAMADVVTTGADRAVWT